VLRSRHAPLIEFRNCSARVAVGRPEHLRSCHTETHFTVLDYNVHVYV
jgi:hypothetical protein